MRRFPWSPLLALLLTAILFRGWTALPLGISGEWTWERILWTDDNRAEVLWGVGLAVIAGALYVAFALWGLSRIEFSDSSRRPKRFTAPLALIGLWLIANGWIVALQLSPPEPYNLAKAAWVTYYPATSGYFYHARYRIDDLPTFLAEYEDWMREGDVLHVGTHPPGLYLLNLAMLRACERSQLLTDVLLAGTPRDVERGVDDINSHIRGTPLELNSSDRAALWGMILLTQALSLATIFPLFALIRMHYSSRAAWQSAALWPLVPAVAVFLPKSDVLYPLLTMLLVWCASRGGGRRSLAWGCLAGAVLFLGLTMSLALLPGLVLTALLMAWDFLVVRRTEASSNVSPTMIPWKPLLVPLAGMVATFAILVLGTWALADLNLLNCWRLNLQNHAGFYEHYPRTYWKWLLVNPLELAVAFGLPVALAVVASYCRLRAHLARLPRVAWGPLVCCPAVWALLWLSGKNMGEAARLWIFLLPWGLWILAPRWEASSRDAPHRRYAWLLVAQMLAAIVTVTGVSGFHLLPF